MTEDLKLTDEEKNLILNRRRLLANRMTIRNESPKNPAKQAQQTNQPNGWDSHNEPDRVHKGRLTENHPLYWFEKNVFQKISNMTHQEQHKKIRTLLGMPIQTPSKDRVYHALCHLDALWTQDRLPVAYKNRYEEYKKEHDIGDDNIHPSHKKAGVVYRTPKNKRPWDPEKYKDYNENEKFIGDR